MISDVDLDLAGRARDGDRDAFEEIYRQYAGMVYRVALRMIGKVEDAEEVTQHVFLSVHRHLRTFAGKSSLKTWIYRITINSSLNVLKARKKHMEVAWEEGFDPEDKRHGLREAVEKEASQHKINVLLAHLNPDQRACILLRAQEGLSYEEISRSLGINVNTVRSRLKRARETLLVARKENRGAL